MQSCFLRLIFVIVFVFCSALSGHPDSSSDDSLFANSESPALLNFPDVSESPFEDVGSDNGDRLLLSLFSSSYSNDDDNIVFDNSPLGSLFADCSTMATDPVVGKSRPRRLDLSEACTNPAKSSESSDPDSSRINDDTDLTNLQSTFLGPGTARALNTDDPNLNFNCQLTTLGLLPWGVCPSPDPRNTRPSSIQPLPPAWGTFELVDLDHCTIGKCEVLAIGK